MSRPGNTTSRPSGTAVPLTPSVRAQLDDCGPDLDAIGPVLRAATSQKDLSDPLWILGWAADGLHVVRGEPPHGHHGVTVNGHHVQQGPEYLPNLFKCHPSVLPTWVAATRRDDLPHVLRAHIADILLRLKSTPTDRRPLVVLVREEWVRRVPGSNLGDVDWLLSALHHTRCIKGRTSADLSPLVDDALCVTTRCLATPGAAQRPGIPLMILRLLTSNKKYLLLGHPGYAVPDRVSAALDTLENLWQGERFAYHDEIARLRGRLAGLLGDSAARRTAQLAEVCALRARAGDGDPLHWLLWTQQALEAAEGYGLTDVAKELRSAIEQAPEPPFFEVELSVPLFPFEPSDGWPATVSDAAKHLAGVTQAIRTHLPSAPGGVLAHVDTDVIGARNAVVARRNAHEHVGSQATLAAVACAHPQVVRALLSHLEEGAGLTPAHATFLHECLIRALQHLAEGRSDEAVYLLVPRIEGALRNLCSALGRPVTTGPTNARNGRERSLSFLGDLRKLIPGADYALDYLTYILVDDEGLNLRNRVAHGNDDRLATELEACIAVGAAVVAYHLIETTFAGTCSAGPPLPS